MNILRSCSRGDENVLHLGVLWVRAGASPGGRGLHSAAQQPIAGLGCGASRGTAVTSDSPTACTRILARGGRSRVGSQASGSHSSRAMQSLILAGRLSEIKKGGIMKIQKVVFCFDWNDFIHRHGVGTAGKDRLRSRRKLRTIQDLFLQHIKTKDPLDVDRIKNAVNA